jgi:glycosyltransferase involved in cell wall biosynthesis
MKVALLSDCYPPRLGGIEAQVHGLATALTAAGHHPEVFTITPGAIADGDVPVHRLGLRRELPGELLINPAARRSLRKALRHGAFDVAHAHLGVVSPFAMDGVAVALELGLPLAATWHSVTGHAEPVVRAFGYPARWARRGAALSAVSRLAARPVERISKVPVTLIPNGIDTSFWSPGAAIIDPAPDGDLRVVSAMRLTGRKRPAQLIDMVRAARASSGKDIRLVIAGDGPLLTRLRARAEPWCELPGRLTPSELRDCYRSSDVYAAPTVLEAFGIAAAEARCCGLPVVTRQESAVADLVEHERTGMTVSDDAEFVAALAEIASNFVLLERLSSYSRREGISFGWPDVREKVVAEYARAQRLAVRR